LNIDFAAWPVVTAPGPPPLDRCEALDDALRTAFANLAEPTLVQVAVD
jgi:hypothetical protein